MNSIKENVKLFIRVLLLSAVFLGILSGCSVTDMDAGEKESVAYEMVSQEEMPDEVLNLIEDKKKGEFQMTYQDDKYLYLIRGYGQQDRGGYSIQVEDLSMGAEAISLKTSLIGPSKEEKQSLEPSYPYIVIRIEYRDMPVQFQ